MPQSHVIRVSRVLRAERRDHRERHDDVADRGQLDDEDGTGHGRDGMGRGRGRGEVPLAGRVGVPNPF